MAEWTLTTKAAPGGGFYYYDATQSAYCNPNQACYQNWVVPNTVPPPLCGEAGGWCWGTSQPLAAEPAGATSYGDPPTTGTADLTTASAMYAASSPGMPGTAVALVAAPVLIVAVAFTVLLNLRKGVRMAAQQRERELGRAIAKDEREQQRERDGERRADERAERRREARAEAREARRQEREDEREEAHL